MPKTSDRQIVNGETYMNIDAEAREDIKRLNKNQESLIDNMYKSVAHVNNYFFDMIHYVKEIEFYTGSNFIDDEIVIVSLGYITGTNQFYIAMHNNTSGSNYEKYFDYESMPDEGIEKLIFSPANYDFRLEITIDWGKYQTDYYISTSNINGQIIKQEYLDTTKVINGINTNMRFLDKIGSCLLSGTFVLNWPIELSPGTKLKGMGATVSVQSGGKIFVYEDSTIEDIEFVGDWEPEREETEEGYVPLITEEGLSQETNSTLYGTGNNSSSGVLVLYGARTHNTSVIGCSFTGIRQICIIAFGGRHKTKDGTIISGNSFTDCWMAIEQMGEFSHISNNSYFRVIVATYIGAGNVSKVGETYKGCDCAIFYPSGGGNPAHGEGVGIEVAHSGVAGIYCKSIPASCGEIFTGCQFVDSPIIAENAYSLLFSGCILNTYIRIDAGQRNGVIANVVGKGYLNNNSLYNVPSDTKIVNNVAMIGATDEEVNPVFD